MKNNRSGSSFDRDWQRSRGSRERLEKISHHFLSEIQPLPDMPPDPVFLPIYIEDPEHIHVARYIADAMAIHCDCALLNVDRKLQRPEDRFNTESGNRGFNVPLTRKNDLASADDMLERLRSIVSEQPNLPELGLVGLSSQHLALITRLQRVLIPVTTTLDGIREAYQNIKKLYVNSIREFSIVMVNTNSPREAEIYFEKFASGTLRFLNLRLMYNGHIPAEYELNSSSSRSLSQNIMIELVSKILQNHHLIENNRFSKERSSNHYQTKQ